MLLCLFSYVYVFPSMCVYIPPFHGVRGMFCVRALTCGYLCAGVQLLSGRVATEPASFVNTTACLPGENLPQLSISPGRQDSHPLSPLVSIDASRPDGYCRAFPILLEKPCLFPGPRSENMQIDSLMEFLCKILLEPES